MTGLALHHVSLCVADLQRSVAFYQTLGFAVYQQFSKPSSGFECVFMRLGVHALELLHYVDEQGRHDSKTPAERRREIGISHIAFAVGDIERAITDLRERGVEISPAQTGASGHRYVHFTDPDGIGLELFELRSIEDAVTF